MRVLTAATSLTLVMLGSAPAAQDVPNPDSLDRSPNGAVAAK